MMVRMRISTIRRSRFSYKFTNGLAYVPHSATVLSGELACAVDWEASQGGVRRYNERGAPV